jgi:hypothetical protein
MEELKLLGGGVCWGCFYGRSLTSVFTNHRAMIAAQRRVAQIQALHLLLN